MMPPQALGDSAAKDDHHMVVLGQALERAEQELQELLGLHAEQVAAHLQV